MPCCNEICSTPASHAASDWSCWLGERKQSLSLCATLRGAAVGRNCRSGFVKNRPNANALEPNQPAAAPTWTDLPHILEADQLINWINRTRRPVSTKHSFYINAGAQY